MTRKKLQEDLVYKNTLCAYFYFITVETQIKQLLISRTVQLLNKEHQLAQYSKEVNSICANVLIDTIKAMQHSYMLYLVAFDAMYKLYFQVFYIIAMHAT